MSDKELLENAAKAAGIEYDRYVDGFAPELFHYGAASGLLRVDRDMLRSDCWNPLHDDGDALRLAVKLRISLMMRGISLSAFDQGETLHIEEWYGFDKAAATRRAIVRAAAAIATAKS